MDHKEKTEPTTARVGVFMAFAVIFLLALLIAACWYYCQGKKSDKTPEAPRSCLLDSRQRV
jgi:hypothetical protein